MNGEGTLNIELVSYGHSLETLYWSSLVRYNRIE